MPYSVYHGVHTLSHSNTYYTGGNFDNEKYMHQCAFMIYIENNVTIKDHVEYLTSYGFFPDSKLNRKIIKYLELEHVNHTIELVGYMNPDMVKEYRLEYRLDRDSETLFERAGITVPTLYDLNGSSLKYPDDLHIFSGGRISGRPANPICTPIELLRSDIVA